MVFVAVYLFISIYLHILPSFNSKVIDSRDYGRLENVVKKYINPLKQLSAKFPNHEVQLQIDFQRKKPRKVPKRRIIYYQPRRIPDDPAPPADTTTTTTTAATTTTTQATTTTTPSPVQTTTPTTTTPASSSNSNQEVLTMEGLKKVLEEFASKYLGASTTPTTAATSPSPAPAPPGSLHGVQLSKNIQLPLNDDIEWVRIKVPK